MSRVLPGRWHKSMLARVIRELRADESQQAFSERAGVSRAALSSYENATRSPDEYTLKKIADAAGVSVSKMQEMTFNFNNEKGLSSLPPSKDITFDNLFAITISLLSLEGKSKLLSAVQEISMSDDINENDKRLIVNYSTAIRTDVENLLSRQKELSDHNEGPQ